MAIIEDVRIFVVLAATAFLLGPKATSGQESHRPRVAVSSPFRLDSSVLAATGPAVRRNGGAFGRRLSVQFDQPAANERSGWTHDYKEISDFFNVREANVNTTKGEAELELEGVWTTNAGEGDDDFTFTPNIKYGFTEQAFVELEVLPLNLGDGDDQGNGDLSLQLFHQFATETDAWPAVAAWVEGRFPSGEGSSGVDGELHLNFTKTLLDDFRTHVEGFVETANGGRGDEDENRRSFQWGSGVGFDYQLDDETICTLNYLNRSSEERGQANQNLLEIGGVRRIAENQHLKFAVDIGLDGHEETPDFGAKIQWAIEW